jgi:hypothetical protein
MDAFLTYTSLVLFAVWPAPPVVHTDVEAFYGQFPPLPVTSLIKTVAHNDYLTYRDQASVMGGLQHETLKAYRDESYELYTTWCHVEKLLQSTRYLPCHRFDPNLQPYEKEKLAWDEIWFGWDTYPAQNDDALYYLRELLGEEGFNTGNVPLPISLRGRYRPD